MKKYIIITICALSFSALHAQTKKQTTQVQDPDNLAGQYFSQVMGVAAKATSNTKLFQFIYDWIGTPYRFGGETRRGIDCSAFTKALYEQVFNKILSRDSRSIFRMVNPVSKDELQEGDLVFFKIKSRSISHVGVYIGDNRFAHASSSNGVSISTLDDKYFQRYFYKGGRVTEAAKEELGFND